MPSVDNSKVVALGKMTVASDKNHPCPPDMDVLVFKESGDNWVYTHRAVCIQLELDASGNSIEDAAEALRKAVAVYLNAIVRVAGSSGEFTQKVIDIVFSESKQKNELFEICRNTKRDYLKIAAENNHFSFPYEPQNMIDFLFKHDETNFSAVTG